MAEVDFLVVGGGIAGTAVCAALEEKNKTFLLVDEKTKYRSSSQVAAGICNPIVFRRLNKSWKINTVLPFALSTYARIGKRLQQNYILDRKILKIIHSEDELNQWKKKLNNVEMLDDLSIMKEPTLDQDFFQDYLAIGEVSNGVQIKLRKLIEDYRKYLMSNSLLLENELDYSDLEFDHDVIRWKDITAKRVIFCEGAAVRKNPFFSYLPLKPVKGEVLIVRIPGLNLNYNVNRKIMLSPQENDCFWVGATYEWKELNNDATSTGKAYLVEHLEMMLKVPFEIVDQQAAIRPTVRDRRPLLGGHPKQSNVYVFNGLGTKGTMLAPFFANQLIEHIENGSELDSEVDIKRFEDLS